MSIGISIFSLYGAPLIACLVWLISLIRLRSWLLVAMTIAVTVLIIVTSSNVIFAVTLNPYLMLVLMTSALVNTLILPYVDTFTRKYLIQADGVFLLMIIALHLWASFIRRSDLYFYERFDYWAMTFPLLLTTLSLAIPLTIILIKLKPEKGRLWSQVMIFGLIVLSLGLGFVLR